MYDAQHNVLNSNIHVPASTLMGEQRYMVNKSGH